MREKHSFKLGSEVFLEGKKERIRNKRIGLLTNVTGVDHDLVSSIDRFHEDPDLTLEVLFAPEHGIRGTAQAGEKFGDSVDRKTGLPVYSLYSESGKIDLSSFKGVDVIFCDLQDIGIRYFTFIYTLADVMKAAGESGTEVVVLDRPNPLGGVAVEGNRVEEEFASFVGNYTLPVRHGMTIGEVARYIHKKAFLSCPLIVVPMEGWQRDLYFDELDMPWVPPTPNTTGMEMALLYAGTCLLEGTNISEGRGTAYPFQVAGAPFIDGETLAAVLSEKNWPGVKVRPVSYTPFMSKYEGEVCEGVQLHVTDRESLQPFRIGVELLETLMEMYPEKVSFLRNDDFDGAYFLDLLFGNGQWRKQIEDGSGIVCEDIPSEFLEERKAFLLYGEEQ